MMNFRLTKTAKLEAHLRLHRCPLPIVALTGGIASGKSTVSHLLTQKGFSLIDADKLVKLAYQIPNVKENVLRLCPGASNQGEIDFRILRSHFYQSTDIKLQIEKLIYGQLPALFLSQLPQKQDFVIYDVPLLFEKDLSQLVDFSVVVYVDAQTQKERLMKRDQINEKLAGQMLAAQWPLSKKKELADYVIDNSSSEIELELEVKKFIDHFFE